MGSETEKILQECEGKLKAIGAMDYLLVAKDPDHISFVYRYGIEGVWALGVLHRMDKIINKDFDEVNYE